MERIKHIVGLLMVTWLLAGGVAHAEVPLVKPDRSVKTLIAPK